MALSKWLINPHTGIFQFRLNLFTLQNKFSLGEMGQIDKPCVTDNCSVIPTESVTWGRFSFTGETCAVTQDTTTILFFYIKYKNTVVLVSSLSGFSVSSPNILGTHVCTQWEINTKQTTHKKLAWVTTQGGFQLSHGKSGQCHTGVCGCISRGRDSTTQGLAMRHPSAVMASLRTKSMSC